MSCRRRQKDARTRKCTRARLVSHAVFYYRRHRSATIVRDADVAVVLVPEIAER